MNHELISIIIPSLNSRIIDQVIEAILTQEKSEIIKEIVIVGRDDFNLIKQDEKIRFIDTKVPVPAGTARNLGINQTESSILIFLDSDCLPQPKWLNFFLESLTNGNSIVSGGVLPSGDGYWHTGYNLAMFHEYFSTHEQGYRNHSGTLNLLVSRAVIDEVGLLDETRLRAQDLEWTMRMRQFDHAITFEPKATIYHNHNRRDFKSFWRDFRRTGYHARKIRENYAKESSLKSMILRARLFFYIFSPLIALLITVKIIIKNSSIIFLNWKIIPAIWLSKVAWCVGASRNSE